MLDLLRIEAGVPNRSDPEELGDPHKQVLNFYRKLSERFIADKNPYSKKYISPEVASLSILTREETYAILKVIVIRLYKNLIGTG
jgi:hypothetical protein